MSTGSSKSLVVDLITLAALVSLTVLAAIVIQENKQLRADLDHLERNALPPEFVLYDGEGDGVECKNYAFEHSEFIAQMVDKGGNTQQYFCRD